MADSGTQYGFGRALVAVYAVFAISATARSIYQLVTKSGEAPLAYGLSALAGLVYSLAAFGRGFLHGLGVDPELFPESTVWSNFGSGYGYVPLILPFVGLWWLLASRRREANNVADDNNRR